MSKIVFLKPALEVDAVWDPIRTCSYLGIWFMASLMKSLGHQVWYLDETVRDGGLQKRSIFKRTLRGSDIEETPLNISPEEFQTRKMADYQSMGAEEFSKKYSAFKTDGVVERTIIHVGNTEDETLAKIAEINPDFVGISLIATANYLPATRLAKSIREKLPRVKIIFGGQHISADPEGFLRDNPFVDHVVVGDAITVIQDIVDGKLTDKIIRGGFQEMGEYPFLDPSIIKEACYPTTPLYTFPTEGRKYADFMFSRGCFRHCSFCVAGCQRTHVSATEYDKVDEQLKIFREHGIKELVIQDDAFLWDAKHVQTHLPKILALMKKHGMHWQNNGGSTLKVLPISSPTSLFSTTRQGKEGLLLYTFPSIQEGGIKSSLLVVL
ncbi:MAG: cobalamin-dependent protein [Candidatus Azambacteria bacterium]|nr:cobalamin-dependent protein [Candidatus Azambacteria bacterium]